MASLDKESECCVAGEETSGVGIVKSAWMILVFNT